MALAPCRECAKEISTEAASCPHCGVPTPTSARPSTAAPKPNPPATRAEFHKPPPPSGPDRPANAVTGHGSGFNVMHALFLVSFLLLLGIGWYGISRSNTNAGPTHAMAPGSPQAAPT